MDWLFGKTMGTACCPATLVAVRMVRVVFAVLGGAGLLLCYFVAYQNTSWFVVAHAVLGNAVLLLAFFFLHRDFLEARAVARDSYPSRRLQTAQVTLVHG